MVVRTPRKTYGFALNLFSQVLGFSLTFMFCWPYAYLLLLDLKINDTNDVREGISLIFGVLIVITFAQNTISVLFYYSMFVAYEDFFTFVNMAILRALSKHELQ